MEILPPPGLENFVHGGAPKTLAVSRREAVFADMQRWSLEQKHAELIRQNAELWARVALINEIATEAQMKTELVEQIRLSNRKGRTRTPSNFAASTCEWNSKKDASDGDVKFLDQRRTTVIMKHIPTMYTRANLLELLDQQGFNGYYDILYLPLEFETDLNHGYAFINFTNTEHSRRFQEHFYGFSDWMVPSDRICEVSWSDKAQGTDENIQHYRNSPVMHESIHDRFKPVLLKNGQRVPFPKPTKRLRAPPRRRINKQASH